MERIHRWRVVVPRVPQRRVHRHRERTGNDLQRCNAAPRWHRWTGRIPTRSAAIDAAGEPERAAASRVQITVDSTPSAPRSLARRRRRAPRPPKPVLVWPGSASNDLAGYNVTAAARKINGSLVTTTSVTDTGLDADGTYVYTVSGRRQGG